MFINKKILFLTLAAAPSPSFTLLKFSQIDPKYRIMVNYNGQADLLLSLQIFPDYYPYQFKQRSLYDYLTNIKRYMVSNSSTSEKKQKLSISIQSKLDSLIRQVTNFGPSLWNEDIYEGGLVNRNEQFWTSKETDYLFLEQFIIDDYSDPLFLVNKLPKHKHLIVTNFRAARDPYTLFNEEVYRYFLSKKSESENGEKSQNNIGQQLFNYYKKYQKVSPNNLYRTAKYIEFWNSFCSMLKTNNGDKDKYKELFKLARETDSLFVPFSATSQNNDEVIAKLFASQIFSEDEASSLLNWSNEESKQEKENAHDYSYLLDYLKRKKTAKDNKQVSNNESICWSNSSSPQESIVQVHHPALEHQTIKGSSPTSEGTQKDLMVYLAQLAVSLKNISETEYFKTSFSSDSRKEKFEKAMENALEISQNYQTRLENIRNYLKDAKIVDSSFDPKKNGNNSRSNSKTVAIVSYPPSQLGAGNSTIQTLSKYPFIYTELGLKEVLPDELKNNSAVSEEIHKLEDIFGIDDNGWWWRLGDSNFSKNGFSSFKGKADSIIFLATEDDWNILNAQDNPKLNSLKSILTEEGKKENRFSYSSYHLWNEGLRSPIALNLLLDVLVQRLTEQFKIQLNNQTSTLENNANNLLSKYQQAMEWGSYWEEKFK